MEEQIALLRRLWTEQSVTFSGTFDQITGAGLAPMPVQRPIPVWVGAQSPRAYRRAGRLADGWFPQMAPGPQLDEARRIVAEAATEAGRDPASLGMEGRLRWQEDRDKLAAAIRQWQDADATHLSVNTMGAGLRTADDHLVALATAAEGIRRFRPPGPRARPQTLVPQRRLLTAYADGFGVGGSLARSAAEARISRSGLYA
jgi:alkanesulfonate monooxygenase SsuD/methylene tetrahydromethanopterin reductase-like flavin-dependent oxidoreductase (luciferase family)